MLIVLCYRLLYLMKCILVSQNSPLWLIIFLPLFGGKLYKKKYKEISWSLYFGSLWVPAFIRLDPLISVYYVTSIDFFSEEAVSN